jgi:hypothetical protein
MREKNPFRLLKDDEEILSPEVLYLSAIKALMHLANYRRSEIAFTVNLLAIYNYTPKKYTKIGSNIYFAIFAEQKKWGYFIVDQTRN